MKKRIMSLLLVPAFALVYSGCATNHPAAWNYKIIYGNSTLQPLESQLNQAAEKGWQVVSSGNDNGLPFIILKKRAK